MSPQFIESTHMAHLQDDSVVLEPDRAADACVIWLHGLGADGNDFVPVVPMLGLPAGHGVRFLFPHAPVRPVTLNMGMAMRAWYDIKSLTAEGREDAEGIAASTRRVDELIAQQREAGIEPGRIVIAGFSQGGAVALHTALRYPMRLAGLLALSTYLPLRDRLTSEAHAANRDLPILMMHGSFDPVVSPEFGAASRDFLTEAGYAVDWRTYPMEHQVCPEQIAAIGAWLTDRLPQTV